MRLIALLSGGLDSTVALTLALLQFDPSESLALTFDYGQRNAKAEQHSSARIAGELGVRHRIISLPFLNEVSSGPMVNSNSALPHPGARGIESGAQDGKTNAEAVWIPHRNGLMIAIAASFADGQGGGQIVVGFNREEAETFPDNSADFLSATNLALVNGCSHPVSVISPTCDLDKTEIVRAGFKNNAPLAHLHSCYENQDPACGRCEPCERLKRALTESGHLRDFLRLKNWETYPAS